MATRFLILLLAYFQVANSQYYIVPASSFPSYYSYSTASSVPASALTYAPNPRSRILPSPPPKMPKRSVSTPAPSVKTASAYFVSTPTEKIKASILTKDKVQEAKSPVPYSCPLCNNFAGIPPNSKIPPPPPIGSPVLPGIIDQVPTIAIPEKLTAKDATELSSILSKKSPLTDMYEKHKLSKKLSFDQELLEGFLTGLGIAL